MFDQILKETGNFQYHWFLALTFISEYLSRTPLFSRSWVVHVHNRMVCGEEIEGEGYCGGKCAGKSLEVGGNGTAPGPFFMGCNEVIDDFFLGGA
jgi:hypothetical protein